MKLKKYLLENYSKSSVRSYENQINRYVLLMEGRTLQGVENASYEEVLNYIGHLRKEGLHAKSLRNNLFAIKVYYHYLIRIGKRKDHPCLYLNLKDQINRSIELESLYTWKNLEEFYENYESKKEVDQRRNKIIISLLIYQALTISEIKDLQLNQVDLEKGKLKIVRTEKSKNTESRTLSLESHQILLFDSYIKEDWKNYHRRPKRKTRYKNFVLSEKGLPIWKSGINKILEKNTKSKWKLKAQKIRQSVIAHLLKSGKDVRIVQEFAGHRCTSSTEAYQQNDLEELKLAINKTHPLQ